VRTKGSAALYCSAILFLCIQYACSEKFAGPQFSKLQKMAKDSPIIKLNTDLYNAYVLEPERNYSTFVLFTATHHKYNCGPCRQQAISFETFANSYAIHFGNLNSEAFLNNPFFLVQLEPGDAMEVFQQYQFQTVPHFTHIAPGKKKPTTIPENEFLRNPTASPEDFASFVNSKVGVEIDIYVSPIPKLIGLAGVVAAIYIMLKLSFVLRNKLRDPMTWFIITMGLYFIVMAGVAYNFIRSPVFSEVNPQTGQVTYISPQARSQYVAEGFIIAGLMTTTALLIITIGDVIPKMKSASQQRLTFWMASAALFICLATLNNIFFAKYHLPAFRLHSLAGLLGRR